MRIGILLRNGGPASQPATLTACALAAEAAGIDDLWVNDHVAIPREQSEGSGGRYLDPLAVLAFLAGITERVGLGTAVLVLPYRQPLPTAKWIASIQELAGGRLRLGAGVGWMEAEFRALGVPRGARGTITDATLAFLHDCFDHDEVEANGQRFIFSPRPPRPPILVGGAPPHALERIVRFGDGWLPNFGDPQRLRAPISELRARMQEAGRPVPEVVPLSALPLEDASAAAAQLAALAAVGATGVIHSARYTDVDEFRAIVDRLLAARDAAVTP